MKFKTKGFTSLLLTCSFSVAAFSGIILYVTPRGRTANWTGWTMLGLDKHSWGALHINACLLFLIVATVHLFLNWRVFWSYIKKRSTAGMNLKAEMAVALLATAALVAGTLYEVPPLTATVTLNEKIKNYWEQGSHQGPAPHAEEFTVDHFASTIGLTTDDVLSSLQQAGYVVEDTEATIGAVAEDNGIVPSQILAAVRKSHPNTAVALPGSGQGMGRGRGMGGGSGRGQGRGRVQAMADGGGCESGRSDAESHSGCENERSLNGSGCGEQGQSVSCESSGCESESGQSASHDGPGMGRGQGRGMGRGMGPGWMRGGGMGMGPGWQQHDEQAGQANDDDQPSTDDDKGGTLTAEDDDVAAR